VTARAALGALALAAAGCFHFPQDHCPGCAIVDETTARLPALRADASAVVVLVPGAFGFGDEWAPVVARLRATRVGFFVFAWPGPWRDPSRAARRLAVALQALLDGAPATVREVLVLAHSAGGLIGSYAARRLLVPPGRRLRLASIAAPERPSVAPFHVERDVNTPLGFEVGGTQEPEPPPPRGVEIVAYRTEDLPRGAAPSDGRVYLGARVGHNAAVAAAALPLLAGLAR
jgi:hypothetical protein